MSDNLINKIESELDKNIRPHLLKHYGNVEIIKFSDGVLYIKLSGKCSNCPSAKFTVEDFIEKKLIENIIEVKKVELFESVSEDIIEFARKILFQNR